MTFSTLLLGLFFSAIIAALGYQRGSLSASGAVGAWIVGGIIFASGGIGWAILLVAFFISSSALSHYRARAKEPLAEKFQKGHRRDFAQVIANGGWGALIALAYSFNSHPLFFAAYLGALATVNADTWATELGVLSQSPPRMIMNGKIVATGTSGAITLLGTFVALCGAGFIAMIGFVFLFISFDFQLFFFTPRLALGAGQLSVVTLAGFLGALFDSFLGATVQAIYFCDYDQTETETRVHRCGRAARLVRGARWLDNDAVNFSASVFGSALAVAGIWIVQQ
ncbi:MAG: DUF92 domain-containing protein [Chloroflexi bacterium]|nr:DUF92 domain-containing protein [Chloroflexota bacterium]